MQPEEPMTYSLIRELRNKVTSAIRGDDRSHRAALSDEISGWISYNLRLAEHFARAKSLKAIIDRRMAQDDAVRLETMRSMLDSVEGL